MTGDKVEMGEICNFSNKMIHKIYRGSPLDTAKSFININFDKIHN